MVSVGVVVFRLISDNETAKAEARLAEGQAAAIGLFDEARRRASAASRQVGSDPVFVQALRGRNRARAEARAESLVDKGRIVRIVLLNGPRVVVDAGDPKAIAPANRQIVGRSGARVGRLQVSVMPADEYARRVRQVTRRWVVLRRGNRLLAAVPPTAGNARLPRQGKVEIGGKDYRVATFQGADVRGERLRISLLATGEATSPLLSGSRILAGFILVGFLLMALAFAVTVSRQLQAQIARFLEAARRLGGGDFATEVPTDGRDEFAELGGEFNKMSRQLAARMEELARERARLQGSIRRIGQTFAANLDRDALLELVVQTAVDGVDATGGRARLRVEIDGQMEERATQGRLDGLRAAMEKAEAHALSSGRVAEAREGESSALSYPLVRSDGRGQALAVMSVARPGRPFSTEDRELFGYLAGQAAVSIENVDLHELVQSQAVTDELTGLSNHRRFQEVLSNEFERHSRFGQNLGFVMLDIDNFKLVNDTYGHQQGDRVLREVARVLRDSCREVDEPARYGGEEFAVALPETDVEGAYNLAERVRRAVEELEIPLLNGEGGVRVTASLGAASVPPSTADRDSLVEAADAALYRAKRAGKNRTERAEATVSADRPG